MAKIEGLTIKNYRVLKDVTLGRLWWNKGEAVALTPMTAVIGKNGVGKSSLFDALGFLADCLKLGVEEACDARGRGGFDRIRSQGSEEPITFHVVFRETTPVTYKTLPVVYILWINSDELGRPYVLREILGTQILGEQRRKKAYGDPPLSYFLALSNGTGFAWKWDSGGGDGFDLPELLKQYSKEPKGKEYEDAERVDLQDKRRLGIATLGVLKQHPRIVAFRQFIEGWYLSYFSPNAARSLPMAGPQPHLSVHGDNLGNVVQFMEREHGNGFNDILRRIAERVPGIDKIDTERSPDGRLLLRFNDKGFHDPFYAQQMSDGTLKVFAYLLMLEDPVPPPFICVEEPENGLYHKLLKILADEFRSHATRQKNPPQIFVTTHQPYFVDALSPNETWILEKNNDGFSKIRRASDDKVVQAMVEEGLPLGGLWYSDYLD